MASMLLVAFATRALIPPGFMPASGRPFSFEICWEDFPADLLAHGEPGHGDSMGMDSMGMDSMPPESAPAHPAPAHPHPGSPSHSEHCVFGTACSAGPIPHLPPPSEVGSAPQLVAVVFVSIADSVRLVHLPPPRAPPSRLS